jgi:hypothetical protein
MPVVCRLERGGVAGTGKWKKRGPAPLEGPVSGGPLPDGHTEMTDGQFQRDFGFSTNQ